MAVRTAVALLGVAVSLACSPTIGEATDPPTGCVSTVAGAGIVLPDDPGCAPQQLTAANVSMWISFASCSPGYSAQDLEAQLVAARGDEAVTDGFFAEINDGWTCDGTLQWTNDEGAVHFVLFLLRSLRDPLALQRLDALVWRPLPPTVCGDANFGFGMLESAAAEAIACIPTPEAQAEAQKIATNHPNQSVRAFAAAKLQDQRCSATDP
jgi:hypothetical protein